MIYNLIAPPTPPQSQSTLWFTKTSEISVPELVYLAPFYQVSRKTREDMKWLFRDTLCPIRVSAMYAHFNRPDSEVKGKHLRKVLPNLQRVALSVSIPSVPESNLRKVVEEARNILGLVNSPELRSFSFTIAINRDNCAQWFAGRRRALRRSVSKEGREKGLSWMQIELEFARRAIEMMLEDEMVDAVTR